MKKGWLIALAGFAAAGVTAVITTVCGKKDDDTNVDCIEGECQDIVDSEETTEEVED